MGKSSQTPARPARHVHGYLAFQQAPRALRRQRVGVLRPAAAAEVEQRSLAVYDAVLGTGADGGAA
jgi:hypothetical protein